MGGWAGCQYNETANNIMANSTGHAAGNPNHNLTAHAATNTTNTTNATAPSTLSATGNPILLLLGICAVRWLHSLQKKKLD